jgi:hypothetical protein
MWRRKGGGDGGGGPGYVGILAEAAVNRRVGKQQRQGDTEMGRRGEREL